MLLTQIESYAKQLFSSTAELGLVIVATTGNWDDKDHTKLIPINPETRFRSIPALTICFKHKGIKEYHVIMEANMWKGQTREELNSGSFRKGEPKSILIIMTVMSEEVKVIAFDTMTMKPVEEFNKSNFESVWSNLMKCPPGAYEALPKEAMPAMENYWNNFSSIQI